MGTFSWGEMSFSESVDGEATVYRATSVFSSLSSELTVTLTAAISTEEVVNGTSSLDPNTMKWGIDISNYPYQGTGTYLALKIALDSLDAVVALNSSTITSDQGNELDALLLATSEDGGICVAAWDPVVSINGVDCTNSTASVVASEVYKSDPSGDVDVVIKGDTDNIDFSLSTRIIYYSILTTCQPSNVYWDPDFAVGGEGYDSSSTNLMPTFAFIIALLIKSLF